MARLTNGGYFGFRNFAPGRKEQDEDEKVEGHFCDPAGGAGSLVH